MSKNIEESNKAYAVPAESQGDVVSTICRIVDEDSPQPMRGMKKANRVPNAAEQFAADHHGEYEARGQQNSDRVGRVLRHNQACPKMYDELEKRRSVVAVVMKRKDALQLSGSGKPKRSERKTTKKRQRRRSTHRSKNQKSRTAKNRLTKRKRNAHRILSSYRLTKIAKTKGCQTFGKPDFSNDDNWTKESVFEQPSQTSQLTNTSEATNKRIGGSEPSVSSYHSFYSTDHEPMVS